MESTSACRATKNFPYSQFRSHSSQYFQLFIHVHILNSHKKLNKFTSSTLKFWNIYWRLHFDVFSCKPKPFRIQFPKSYKIPIKSVFKNIKKYFQYIHQYKLFFVRVIRYNLRSNCGKTLKNHWETEAHTSVKKKLCEWNSTKNLVSLIFLCLAFSTDIIFPLLYQSDRENR